MIDFRSGILIQEQCGEVLLTGRRAQKLGASQQSRGTRSHGAAAGRACGAPTAPRGPAVADAPAECARAVPASRWSWTGRRRWRPVNARCRYCSARSPTARRLAGANLSTKGTQQPSARRRETPRQTCPRARLCARALGVALALRALLCAPHARANRTAAARVLKRGCSRRRQRSPGCGHAYRWRRPARTWPCR